MTNKKDRQHHNKCCPIKGFNTQKKVVDFFHHALDFDYERKITAFSAYLCVKIDTFMRHFYTLCAFYQNLQPLVLCGGHQEGAEDLAFRVILDGYVLADEVVGSIAPTVFTQPR